MKPDPVVELDDRWLVPMLGTVTQCRLDHAFSVIVVVEPTGTFEVRIEQPFVVSHDGEEITLDPEGDPVHLGPALHVLRTTVKQAIAFKSGGLELMFDNGVMLRVPEDENYEAWTIAGPDALRFVSTPGGGLAIWSAEA